MLRVKYPVIVEGRYDKIKLSSILEADILTTDGFSIFNDREKLLLIRKLAEQDKVILLTDSDRAGFRIRSYLSGAIPADRLVQIFIPELAGKEKRKQKPSAEGTVGVEGVPAERLRTLFAQAGVLCGEDEPPLAVITRQQLYELGLSGGADSAALRRRLAVALGLPQKLSTGALCTVLPRLTTPDKLAALVRSLTDSPH